MEPEKFIAVSEIAGNQSDRESSIESFHTNQSELSVTTESELIDIDDFELSDEESWLYKSPKKALPIPEKCDSVVKQSQSESCKSTDDVKPKESRHELLGRLNQLVYQDSACSRKNSLKNIAEAGCSIEAVQGDKRNPSVSEECTEEDKDENSEWLELKHQKVLDVVDVQKLARLQEESLKQSSYKFPSHSGVKTPRSRDLSPASPSSASYLNKPASVEGLNTYSDRVNPSYVLEGMKKPTHFGSSSALDASLDYHRSSLPNINKGYNSLKPKKPKRPSEPKVSCPLPICPTSPKKVHSRPQIQALNFISSHDHQQSSTLPSSYRSNSRRNSATSRSNSLSRRDSSPFSSIVRRDSTPVLGTHSHLPLNSPNNYRKFSSPVPTNTIAISPTKAFALKSPQSPEHYRAASHSPARRLPLSMVQHPISPKKENSFRSGEIRQSPVKALPKEQHRSGIPKPSSGRQDGKQSIRTLSLKRIAKDLDFHCLKNTGWQMLVAPGGVNLVVTSLPSILKALVDLWEERIILKDSKPRSKNFFKQEKSKTKGKPNLADFPLGR